MWPRVLGEEAVVGLHTEGYAPVHLDFFPAPEAVELRRVLSPGTGLHHQVRRPLRLPGHLAENGLIPTQGRIAEEKFNEKGLGLAGLGVMGGEGVPPPVVAFGALRAEKLTGVAGDIVFIEHVYVVFVSGTKLLYYFLIRGFFSKITCVNQWVQGLLPFRTGQLYPYVRKRLMI